MLQEEKKGTPKPNRRVIMASDHFLAWRFIRDYDQTYTRQAGTYNHMPIYLFIHMMNALCSKPLVIITK